MAAVKGKVRLLVPSAAAKPSPAIGQALGPLGVNMMEFCKAFNARTEEYQAGIPLPVSMVAFQDRTFEFQIKTPQTSWLIKKAVGIEKGAGSPGNELAGTITVKQVYEIAKVKQADMQQVPLESICKTVIGQCKSMGVEVVYK